MNSELEQPNRFTPTGMPVEEFRKLYRAYEGYKERHEKLDFDRYADAVLSAFA